MRQNGELPAAPGGILIAAEYRAPKSGNFIASLLDLAAKLAETGRRTVFLFPKTGEERPWVGWIRQQGFAVFFLADGLSAAEQLAVLREIVSTQEIGLIHLHFGYLEGLLLRRRRELGVRLVIHDHFDFLTHGNRFRQRLSVLKRAWLIRRCDAYCISVMKQKNRWYWPAGKARHCWIANGLSLRRAERDELTREDRRAEIGLREGEKLVLLLGWDVRIKGLDVAARAVELCRKTDPGVRLGVIGVGSQGKPAEHAERFLRERGIDPCSDAILYMHSYEDIFALDRAVDCYISSSRAEAFSYGLLEAVSQNTPVVVSDIKGTRWCRDYEKCVVYPTEDAEACAQAILRALRLGRAPSNWESVVRRYTNDVWTDRVIRVYERELRRGGGKPSAGTPENE